jgi:hypothetical protein
MGDSTADSAGDSTPRQQQPDAQGTGEARDETAEQEQESQAEPDSPSPGDTAKKEGHGDESKFHG